MDRRSFLNLTYRSSQCLIVSSIFGACGGSGSSAPRSTRTSPPTSLKSNLANIGPLQTADANGIRLPSGFSSRIVASSGKVPSGGTGYEWHPAPDGGAVFDTADGWIYVSNSEIGGECGGVGALRFDAFGRYIDAYQILYGTNRNCAGGATPWNTWLSCEEVTDGIVWECDPTGRNLAVARFALGRFTHEAVAVDPETCQLYLTEDKPDGRWYRFTPEYTDADGYADLSSGVLEVATYCSGVVSWLLVPDPSGAMIPTRHQVGGSTAFNGGEGTSYYNGFIYFTTKGDNRIWAYQISSSVLSIVYDVATAATPILAGVDNLEVSRFGDLLVAEDRGDMEIIVITPSGDIMPLLQMTGHDASEITGPAFAPDYSRLYFSSQRGASGVSSDGVTYEVSGPFTTVS